MTTRWREGILMEVRQAAMIVATTCLVTFGVVLAALLMVRG
jgi:hypothetical protein